MSLQQQVLIETTNVISYVHSNTLSDKELNDVLLLLQTIPLGKAGDVLISKQQEDCRKAAYVVNYFQKNPRHYIVMVGACKIPQQQIVGLARPFGIEPRHLRIHRDYSKLKKRFPFEEIQNPNCVAVIVGSVPHNANGSTILDPVSALKASKNGSTYIVPGMKFTKENLKETFTEIIGTIALG